MLPAAGSEEGESNGKSTGWVSEARVQALAYDLLLLFCKIEENFEDNKGKQIKAFY